MGRCGLGGGYFKRRIAPNTKTIRHRDKEKMKMIINYNPGGSYSIGKDGGFNYTRHT